ncbi:MAG: hypothetical protein IT467_09865 [Dokdonella sp.]|uniref:hypothetical protein n=1 Tax=Dokdonella sp. TaxID=2291710 RepID=UPI0025C5C8F9|nr:hypothetical protein [Dokdonella sp.]MBZ0222856.1 hypothetical protein [Dokdonella sp.]MCC7256218.1 hypothetical protein [Dokdonella sp.]
MSVKLFVVSALAGAIASVAQIADAQIQSAASVTVNQTSLSVQTPLLPVASPSAGITYTQAGAGASQLRIFTSGFLFCANPGPLGTGPVSLIPAHEDQSFTPATNAHPWTFPQALDVSKVNYSGGVLNLNRNAAGVQFTSLVCNGVGPLGENATGLSDGIFRNGLDDGSETNYSHMINWTPDPQLAFNWNQPDWSQVPVNPCVSTAAQPATVVEDVACAAVTGVRPAPGAGPVSPQRAGTVWTDSHDAVKFTYLFRVDVRAGAQPQGPQSASGTTELPVLLDAGTVSDAYGGALVKVIDAYDASLVAGTGQYCLLTSLPATLGSGVCTGNPQTYSLGNGPLSINFGVYPAPLGNGSSSFYVAVVRDLIGTHPNYVTPAVGVSILMESASLQIGGDRFNGDDTAFGFMTPNSAGGYGFPWMREP